MLLNNKFIIALSGIICVGFVLCGIIGILKYTLIKIILAVLLIFLTISLFYINLKPSKGGDKNKTIDQHKDTE